MDGVRKAEGGRGSYRGNSLGSIWGREVGGRSSSPHRGPCGRLRELRCAGWRREYAAGNSLGPGWRESAGIFGCPVGGSVADGAVRPGVEWLAAGQKRG